MKFYLRLILILGIAVVGILLFNKFFGQQDLPTATDTTEQNFNGETGRNWANTPLKEIAFSTDPKDSLYRPQDVFSYNGNIFVTDYGDMKIKQFSNEGMFIQQFGEFIGRGPSDFEGIMDLQIYNGLMYVLDRNQYLKIFDIENKETPRSFIVDQMSDQLLKLEDYLIVTGVIDYKFFTIYDDRDSVFSTFGSFIEGQQQHIMSYEGYLLPGTSTDDFLYIPVYADYVFHFNIKGELLQKTQLIDKQDFPKSTKIDNGMRAPRPNKIVLNVAKTDSLLFILNASKNADDQEEPYVNSFIDVYSSGGENYLQSIKLPFVSTGLDIDKNIIYLIDYKNGSIKKFQLPKNLSD